MSFSKTYKMKHLLSIIFLLILSNYGTTKAQSKEINLAKLNLNKLNDLYYDNTSNEKLRSKILKFYYNKAVKSDSSIYVAQYYYMLLYNKPASVSIKYFDSVIKYTKGSKSKFFPFTGYREKAFKLIQLGRYNEAMENFNLAVKEVKNKDLDLYYRSRLDIATFISEHYGDVMEALPIYKECYNYSKNQKYTGNNFSYLHTNVLFCLADAYKSLKKTDSCSYYNRIGYKLALKTNDEYYKYLFVLNEGSNQINKKKYKIALDSINKSLPKFIEFKDSTNVIAGYYYRGKAYEKLGLKNLAVKNFQLVDSVYRKTKSIFPEFTDGYTYLVNYYKRSGDKENHLKYLTQLTSIDSLINKKNHLLNKVIIKKYQIPNLIEKKDTTIQSLKSNYIIAIITTILSICLVLILFLNNKKQKKLYKERFQELIKELDNKTIITEPIAQNEKIIIEEKEIGINEEKLNDILEKLTVFENEKGFLKINLTIQNVADEFQTNTKYVSKIINEYKQKTFIQYINDLRIDYALRILQKDDKIRRFTILALANEFGFNTAESFSNAFSKKTGIKPSYFIKELNNSQTSVN